jgi:hypothetical protein
MTFAQMYISAFAGLVVLGWLIGFVFDYLRDALGGR